MQDLVIKTKEVVNKQELDRLLSLPDKEIKSIVLESKKEDEISDNYINNLKQKLREFSGNSYVTRRFKFKDYPLVGRRSSDNDGLMFINSNFRKLLGKDCNREIDMINCHPTILLKLAKDLKVPYLKYFVENTQKIKKTIMNHGLSKLETNKLFYHKYEDIKAISISKIKNSNIVKFIIQYNNELKKIVDYLYNNPYYKFYRKYENDPIDFVTLILYDIENKLLERTIDYLNYLQIPVRTLVFDGLIIGCNNYLDSDLITNLNKLTADYNIKWKFNY